MLVHLRTSALRQTTIFEYLIRFVLGGLDPACWKSIWKKVLLDLREDLAAFAEIGLT